MPDGYLISVGVKADFSELKQGSAAAAETVQEMASEIVEAFSEADDAAETSGQTFTEMAEAYAQVEAQGLSVVQAMNEIADATATQAAAAADAAAASTAAASDTTQSMSAVALATGQLNAAYERMAGVTLQAANSQNRVSSVLQQYRSGALAAGVATQLLTTELRENAAATAMLAASKAEAIAAQSALTQAEERAAAVTAESAVATSEAAAAEAEEAAAAAEDAVAVDALGAAHRGSVSSVAAASGAIREFEGALPIRAVERFMATTLGLGPILQAAFPVIGAIALGEVILQTAGKLHSVYTELLGIKTLREDIEKGNAQDAQKGGQAGSQAIQIQHEVSMKSNPLGTLGVDMDGQVKIIQALESRIAAAQKSADTLRDDAKWANPVFGQSKEKDLMDAGGQEAHKAALQEQLAEQQSVLARMQQQFADEKDKEAKAAETAEEKKQRAAETTARKQEEAQKKFEEAREHQQKGDAEAATGLSKAGEEGQKATDKENDEMLIAYEKELQAELKKSNAELDEQAKKTREAMAGSVDQNQRKQTTVKSQAQGGEISPTQEAAELKSLIDQKMGIQNAYYQALEVLYSKDSVEWQKVEDERLAALRKGADEESKIDDDTARKQEQSYTKAAKSINKAFISTMDSVLRGQESISRGAQKMASGMLVSVVNSLAQQALKWAQTYEMQAIQAATTFLKVNVFHMASVTTQAATDASANATKVTTGIATNLALATSYAGVAAAAAYASTAAIPIIGPELAPGVAAASLGGATGFAAVASASGGWDRVPSDTMAAIHKDEMVMSAPLANKVRNMTDGGGGTHVHNGGNTFNGVADSKTFSKMLNKHERSVVKATKKAMRNGRS